jgi:predicted nucleic acid-binding protein
MSVAIDTSILIDLLAGEPGPARRARDSIEVAISSGAVAIAPVVYAELLAFPGRQPSEVDQFLADVRITVAWEIPAEVWRRAGSAFAGYVVRRRTSGGDRPRRLLADFLIGAHAVDVGTLLTRDPEFYRTNFPELRIVSPVQ